MDLRSFFTPADKRAMVAPDSALPPGAKIHLAEEESGCNNGIIGILSYIF